VIPRMRTIKRGSGKKESVPGGKDL